MLLLYFSFDNVYKITLLNTRRESLQHIFHFCILVLIKIKKSKILPIKLLNIVFTNNGKEQKLFYYVISLQLNSIQLSENCRIQYFG